MSVHEAFDSLGPAGRLQRNILSSVAQYEREQMLERCRSGLRAKAQAGWWPGGPPPFGSRLEPRYATGCPVTAERIADLATALGPAPDALTGTVDAFNASVAVDADERFAPFPA